LAVDALLAQHREPRADAGVDEGRGDVLRRDRSPAPRAGRGHRHRCARAPRRRSPGCRAGAASASWSRTRAVAARRGWRRAASSRRHADAMRSASVGRPMTRQQSAEPVLARQPAPRPLGPAHLHHRAQLLAEQGPAIGAPAPCVAAAGPDRSRRRSARRRPSRTGSRAGRRRSGRDRPAAALGIELLDGGEQPPQQRRVVQVRRFGADAPVDLRQAGAAEAVLPAAEVDQHQLGLAEIGAQLRGQTAAASVTGAKAETISDSGAVMAPLAVLRVPARPSSCSWSPCPPGSRCRAPGTAPCPPRARCRRAARPRRDDRRRPSSWRTA
jgi:hypothetical protein